MREMIHTIPINDAFRADGNCPLCTLELKLEDELLEYVLGASYMDPDIRIETNASGFCLKHFEMLHNQDANKLGLALILTSHIAQTKNDFVAATRLPNSLGKKRKKDKSLQITERAIAFIEKFEAKCFICEKIERTMKRYVGTIIKSFFSDKEFKELFMNKTGYCLPHLKNMLIASKKLSGDKLDEIVNVLLSTEVQNLTTVLNDLDGFTRKFNYLHKDEPWGNSKDAVPKAIKTITGPARLK
jgi:hypothetical protein